MGECPSVFIHVVSYNSERWIRPCLEAALAQDGFTPGENLKLHVTDNASSDGTVDCLQAFQGRPGVSLDLRTSNIGFCGGHNRGAKIFLESDAEWFLIVNPDLALAADALQCLVSSLLSKNPRGFACPLLLRADSDLRPLTPRTIDSAGIELHPTIRHFDRAAGEQELGQFSKPEVVFGGSGACLLFSRSFVEQSLLVGEKYEHDLYQVHPELKPEIETRVPFFDEGFFAYREDAELAWRANRLGLECLFVPQALGFHVRKVTPERRAELPDFINALGVRNRFLLQATHLNLSEVGGRVYFLGWLRNLLVVVAVLLREQSSLRGLRDAWCLWRRARERGGILQSKQPKCASVMKSWFSRKGLV